MTIRETEIFADGDVHVLRQIDSKSKSTALVMLPGILPTIQSLFIISSVLRVNESDQKWGVTQYPFWNACVRVYRAVSTNSGSSPFWHDYAPFRYVAIWCAPDWFKIITGWRLCQVVVARRKDYVRRQTDQRARPAQT